MMNESERREHPRYEMEIGVTISVKHARIRATLVDIGGGGIGVVSEKAIVPGSGVYIAVDELNDYTIRGIVKWSYLRHEDGKTRYRMGIETDSIVLNSEGEKNRSEKSELMEKLRAETQKTLQNSDSHLPAAMEEPGNTASAGESRKAQFDRKGF